MKRFFTVLLVAMMALTSLHAEAKRLGGGKSMGRQSTNVTQRQATPPAVTPNTPANPAAANAARPGANPAAAAQPAKRPWGAMLGGLAAGLGLAWLANSLGLGAGFGNILLMGLLALVAFMVIRRFMGNKAAPSNNGGFAYQGAGNSPQAPATLRDYNPKNVGNDASARPWEAPAAGAAVGAAGGSIIGSAIGGSALSGSQTWGIPADFDTNGFVTAAKRNFITLQDAWDRGDIPALRAMMTDDMLAETQSQLAERAHEAPGVVNKTEVPMLDAQLLGIEDTGTHYLASVEFTCMIREDAGASPHPFREVWNMTKPKQGGGWLVAGLQSMQ